MPSDELTYEQDGPVVTLTLNRPNVRNSISSPTMGAEFLDALARINSDQSVRCAILTGAGSAFCSGGDLNNMERLLDTRQAKPINTLDYYTDGIQKIGLAFEALEVPVFAAVNGAAFGGGLDLACMCDVRIAARRAIFAENYVRLGLISGTGGYWFLPRVIGYARACELALTGETIDAARALSLNLVSEVVHDAELMTATRHLADKVAANSGRAVRAAKRLMKQGLRSQLPDHLALVASLQSLLHATPDHASAVKAAAAKLGSGATSGKLRKE